MLNEQRVKNEEKYYEAIEAQKMPKTGFRRFLEEKEISRRLEEEKDRNRLAEERLTLQATGWARERTGLGNTLNHTHSEPYLRKPAGSRKAEESIDRPDQVLNQFMCCYGDLGRRRPRAPTSSCRGAPARRGSWATRPCRKGSTRPRPTRTRC